MVDRRLEDRPSKDDWKTPPRVVYALRRALSIPFNLDPCADAEHDLAGVGIRTFYTKKDDGLNQSWGQSFAFVNPPFSQKDRWINKAIWEANKGATVGVLLEAITDSKLFQAWIAPYSNVYLLSPRIRFINPDTGEKMGDPMRGHLFAVFNIDTLRHANENLIHTLDLRGYGYRGARDHED